MTLKEAFRYQNFLAGMSRTARSRLVTQSVCMNEQKIHKRDEADPKASNFIEEGEKEYEYNADQVLMFLEELIKEKSGLCQAICKAKANSELNLDAALEINKFKQDVSNSIKNMLNIKAGKRKERGVSYRINEEGNQTSYYYDVEDILTEAYDKKEAKSFVKRLESESDKTSADVDAMLVTTIVNWDPKFDINDSFEDIMTDFI